MPLIFREIKLTLSLIAFGGFVNTVLFFMFHSLYSLLFMTEEQLKLSYFFSLIPIFLWMLSMVIIAFSYLLIGVKIKPSKKNQKVWFQYLAGFSAVLSIIMGLSGKPYIAQHLLDSGYKLDHTIEASTPWRFDTDVYIKVQK